jgi:hypothetical protein
MSTPLSLTAASLTRGANRVKRERISGGALFRGAAPADPYADTVRAASFPNEVAARCSGP